MLDAHIHERNCEKNNKWYIISMLGTLVFILYIAVTSVISGNISGIDNILANLIIFYIFMLFVESVWINTLITLIIYTRVKDPIPNYLKIIAYIFTFIIYCVAITSAILFYVDYPQSDNTKIYQTYYDIREFFRVHFYVLTILFLINCVAFCIENCKCGVSVAPISTRRSAIIGLQPSIAQVAQSN